MEVYANLPSTRPNDGPKSPRVDFSPEDRLQVLNLDLVLSVAAVSFPFFYRGSRFQV